MNDERISDERLAIAGDLRKRWRKLSLDDVLFYDGSLKYLVKRLQERYGIDRREALLQVFEFRSNVL